MAWNTITSSSVALWLRLPAVNSYRFAWKQESWGLIITARRGTALSLSCSKCRGWKWGQNIMKHLSFQPWTQECLIHLQEYFSEGLSAEVSSSCIPRPHTAWSPLKSEKQPSRCEMWEKQVNRQETRLCSPAGNASHERQLSTKARKTCGKNSLDLWSCVWVQLPLAARVPTMGPVLGIGQ